MAQHRAGETSSPRWARGSSAANAQRRRDGSVVAAADVSRDRSPRRTVVESRRYAATPPRTQVHVALFVPNLIGYARIVLLFICYFTALRDWKVATVCYALSRAETKLHGAFKMQFLCAPRGAGVFPNI